FVRHALLNLKQSNPALYRNLLQSLVAHDRSCVSAVLNDTMPVVVDGSNVAWHDIKEKPRLRNIIDLRSELRSEGYFPVYIYVDAALPHQVDKATALQQLIESGAILAVESHTDAEQAILEQAKRLSCPVVTNDKMTDWDPEDEVPKLRFAIDRFGVTIYDR
ncbi:MAG: NYN domain-containing protein, partial [Armatimonadota bacterium]